VSASQNSSWLWKLEEDSAERADLAVLRAIEGDKGEWSGEPVSCSRSQIQRLIEEGRILADGAPLKGNAKLKAGTQVEVQFPKPRPSEILPEDRPIDVLFQDEHILVINKPPGLTVHPSNSQSEGTLVNALLHHLKTGQITDLSGIGGVMRPGIVHRIDKDTSGALVITKSDVAHRALVETFSKHDIQRRYWALCYGSPAESKREIKSLIGRNPKDRKKMSMEVKEGRKAVTHMVRLEEFGRPKPFASWLELSLETGRTHQIRVHLTGIGHSLLGDPVYGTPSEKQPKWTALPHAVREAIRTMPGQALHARTLGFKHPVTGKELFFEAEPPESFKALLEALKASALLKSS
jgi:23S rRNA pseudouridine1911/1915/1917 synthase